MRCQMYKFSSLFKIFFFALGVFYSTAVYAFNFFGYEEKFFECLKNCTDFLYKQELFYGKEHAQSYYDIEIKLLDNDKCFVAFREQTHEGVADSSDVEAFEFPVEVLEEINKNNFSSYAEKYDVIE